jgi:hypothetical protein
MAPAVLYAKKHPKNSRYHDPKMLALALRIGDLLASEHEKGLYEPRGDSDWDTGLWLEAYRLLERELGEERRKRWQRAIEENVALLVSTPLNGSIFPGTTRLISGLAESLCPGRRCSTCRQDLRQAGLGAARAEDTAATRWSNNSRWILG